MCVKCYSRKLEGFDQKANLCRYELNTAAVEIHKECGLDIVAVEIYKEYGLDIVAVEIHKKYGLDIVAVEIHKEQGPHIVVVKTAITKPKECYRVRFISEVIDI